MDLHIDIPPEAAQILEVLHLHGYEAFVVGGCVRDALLGRIPGDWDITTSALPEEVKSCFLHTVDTGIQHGTVMVLKNGCGYEVTTYRIDGTYEDGRHPTSVTFTRSLEEDLKRRDFTINAFAWGEEGLIDLFHGLEDLEHGVIRCVGDPDRRFDEDALRIMRAVRFSAQLGFEIEEKTGRMIVKHAPRLQDISMERIRVEWEKTLLSDHPTYVDLYADYGIAPFIIQPGYERCFSHEWDALLEELNRRRAAVQYDTGDIKGASDRVRASIPGECTAQMYRVLMITAFLWNLTEKEAEGALRYLKYDNKTREAVTKILRFRSEPATADRVRIKQAMNRMGKESWIALLELRDASLTSQVCLGYPRPENLDLKGTLPRLQADNNNCLEVYDGALLQDVRALTAEILEREEPFTIAQLAVNGSDLMKAGIPAGKILGEILENILQKVMQSPTLNEKDILCDYAVKLFRRKMK